MRGAWCVVGSVARLVPTRQRTARRAPPLADDVHFSGRVLYEARDDGYMCGPPRRDPAYVVGRVVGVEAGLTIRTWHEAKYDGARDKRHTVETEE